VLAHAFARDQGAAGRRVGLGRVVERELPVIAHQDVAGERGIERVGDENLYANAPADVVGATRLQRR
jgi:hypothetical protein